ncbi:InlB B-repeat-containing protein [Bombiscardovia coagulans]|uniref:Regulator of chromosome condensation (RCC1) repeat n=1 Tax=Bombiscardovia coagulans TaxID=686666 RepID=A0A261ER09_9BIFI|nr:InlB B-repeat-containing protein [Bombiscardovia coagulans]OZG49293.1 Regulator of chromosome condensation (RCC1) repeat [Bombiscardovia coagulans]
MRAIRTACAGILTLLFVFLCGLSVALPTHAGSKIAQANGHRRKTIETVDGFTLKPSEGPAHGAATATITPPDVLYTQVSVGDYHAVAIGVDGYLYSWGLNRDTTLGIGKLPEGSPDKTRTPVRVKTPEGLHFKHVSASNGHTLAIDVDGKLWGWGRNEYSMLGDGTDDDRYTPVRIASDKTFVDVSTSEYHSLAIDSEGHAWGWGDNEGGEVGDGTTDDRNAPVRVASDKTFTRVQTGMMFSLALDSDGNIWGWGVNEAGQLGLGHNNYENLVPQMVTSNVKFKSISISDEYSLAVDSNGRAWSWGKVDSLGDDIGAGDNDDIRDRNTPGTVATSESFSGISAGEYHSLGLTTDGKIIAWGENDTGALGDGTKNTAPFYRRLPVRTKIPDGIRFKQVDTGVWNSVALDSDGRLWFWGDNYYGINCGEPRTDMILPVKTIQPYYTITGVSFGGASANKISEDSGTRSWTVDVPLHEAGVVNVKVSSRLDGRAASGTDVTGTSNVNTTLKYEYKDAYTVEFDLGGAPGTAPQRQVVIQQTPITWPDGPNPSWAHHWFDGWFTEDGEAWNFNDPVTRNMKLTAKWEEYRFSLKPTNGFLGGGTPISITAPDPPQDIIYLEVSGGSKHSVALGSDGYIYAWGENNHDAEDEAGARRYTPIRIDTPAEAHFTSISAGLSYSLAIDSKGNAWGWGSNASSQLGDGTQDDRQKPVRVKTSAKFDSISAGSKHALAVDDEGSVWGWGGNDSSQLGDGTTRVRREPVRVKTTAKFACVSAGFTHSLAVDDDGKAWAWGSNGFGQLGDGTTDGRLEPAQVKTTAKFASVSAGSEHSLAVDNDGKAWAWGSNGSGRLGDGTTDGRLEPAQVKTTAKFASVSAGSEHSLAVDNDGKAWAWGSNGSGRLGDGTTDGRLEPAQVKTTAKFASVSAGSEHSLAIFDEGNAWAWGINNNGQLGSGTADNSVHSTPMRVSKQYLNVKDVIFDTTSVDPAPVRNSGTNIWKVISPAHSAGPVDVTIRWTVGGLPQDDYVLEKGFLYWAPFVLPNAGSMPFARISGVCLLAMSVAAVLVLKKQRIICRKIGKHSL